MQRYSPGIPWVTLRPKGPFSNYFAQCQVCKAVAEGYAAHIDAFARAHAEHRAPAGSFGLGDLVARVAKPIARAVGQPPCTPCEARRYAMNQVGARASR